MLHYRLERESQLSDEIVTSLPRPSNRPEKTLEGSTIEEMGIVIDRLIHKKHRRGPAVHPPALISTICRMASRDRLRALRGKAVGDESLVRRRFRDRRRRSCPLSLDLGEQPCFGRGSRPLLLGVIISKTAGREDYGAELSEAAAITVVEVHKRKAGPGHGILQERDRLCLRQAMLAAQMQNNADKAMAAVSVVITASCPVAIVGKKLEHEIEQLHRFHFRFGHLFACLRSGLQTHGSTGRPRPHRRYAQLNDLSRSLVALDQDSTIIAVAELSQSSWLGA
jgi:hypothetical protein